jgi:hypothetical protein
MPFTGARTSRFRAENPKTTIVIQIDSAKIDRINTLIDAFADSMPTDLQVLLLDVQKKLPKG